MTDRLEVLKTAMELTTGDRRKNYGSPHVNHERIAKIWEVILGIEVTPSQVALCMVGTKLARLVETPDHLDSFIDGAAYMAIAAEIVKTPERETDGNSTTKPEPVQADSSCCKKGSEEGKCACKKADYEQNKPFWSASSFRKQPNPTEPEKEQLI